MPTTLIEWQKHLEQHFAALASARADSGYPLFALEHGLEPAELRSIKELLRAHIAGNHWLASAWLVWVVYATEFGYEYFGDEYWQSFDEYTPHWPERGKREYLRDWFAKFQAKYNGIEPTGPWAKSFSIIAWPITHAILPRYLQSQFARTLYDLRYQLARLEDLSPRAIGQYIAENAWDTSSRFRIFLQQDELTGRLVLALLGTQTVEGQSPIYPPTLKRLVSDLEAAQSAREWLKETRRLVGDRIEGARTQARTSTSGSAHTGSPRNEKAELPDLRPKLMLRRSSSSTWSVVLEIPNFARLLARHPELRRFLMTTRCKIAGAWSPAGALLSGPYKRVVLTSWIAPDTLLSFEKPNATLDQFVRTEVRLSSGPNWLFRIGNDGMAVEIVGRLVRPGKQYVVLSEGNLPNDNPLLTPSQVDCHGAKVATLAVPTAFTAEHAKRSQQLGFQVVRTVKIWPAGLPAKAWDGEGKTEWLTTDAPCFGLLHDHAGVQAYNIRLNSAPASRIDSPGPGEATYIQLAPLPVGNHTLRVQTITHYAATNLSMAEGTVALSVREPQTWVPGTTHHSGLIVSVEPPAPSLDDFLDGIVSATILGPAGHRVTASVALLGKQDENACVDLVGNLNLPVSANEWQHGVSRLLANEETAWKYLENNSARLIVRGEELGEFILRLDREVKPVRWIYHRVRGAMVIRLVEDTGTADPPICELFNFQRPVHGQTLDLDLLSKGSPIKSPGGLFLARKGAFRSSLVVSAPLPKGSLQSLGFEPSLDDFSVASNTMQDALDLILLWIDARLAGPLAKLRRAQVVNALLWRIYAHWCGPRWAEAELACRAKLAPALADQLQRLIGGSPGFAALLRRDFQRMDTNIEAGKEWFADTANRYGVSADRGLCEFALQFASQPHLLQRIPILPVLLNDLAKQTILMRGARFVSLLSASEIPLTEGVLLPRWKW